MSNVILGAIAMASIVAALFFLKFWRETGDRLFLLFSLAFAVDAASRLALSATAVAAEYEPWFYVPRLLSFALILIAIIDKNRAGGKR